jgi:hypothetical protein
MERGSDHDALVAALSRRAFMQRAGLAGLGALVATAVPVAHRLIEPQPAWADVSLVDGTLQAFFDTILPGRKVARTALGNEIHPQAIAGRDSQPGAVEADALALAHHPLIGFDALAPALLTEVQTRSLPEGGDFLSLPFDRRERVLIGGLDFGNPTRVVWEAGAAVPFTAFCAAALIRNATSATAPGLRVMGLPGTAPNGYRSFSYGRKLSKERTLKGYLP